MSEELKIYIKCMVEDDYECGSIFSPDDVNVFNKIVLEDNPKVSQDELQEAWGYYWEVYNIILDSSLEGLFDD